MCSATVFLPCNSTLLTSWVTSGFWYTGSGVMPRCTAGPLRGTLLADLLGTVARPGLPSVADPRGIEGAADDLVTDAGQVAYATASDEHDRVLLEVVPDAGDVHRDLDPGG